MRTKIEYVAGTFKPYANPRFAGMGTATIRYYYDNQAPADYPGTEVYVGAGYTPAGTLGSDPITDESGAVIGHRLTTGDDGFRSFYQYVLSPAVCDGAPTYDRESDTTRALFGVGPK